MTKYEILSIFIACVAALTSLVVWIGQRRLSKEANELQRATAELAKKQLEILLREEKGKNTTRLTLDLVRESSSSFRFWVKNIGEQPAMDVELELLLDEKTRTPIVDSEYQQKFPAKHIDPGSSVSLIAVLTLSSPSAYNAVLKWSNADGPGSRKKPMWRYRPNKKFNNARSSLGRANVRRLTWRYILHLFNNRNLNNDNFRKSDW